MKNSLLLKSLAIVGIAVLAFQACKKEKTYELQTLVAAGVDLNGASSATGVAATADIVATFSEPINASTANSTNVSAD